MKQIKLKTFMLFMHLKNLTYSSGKSYLEEDEMQSYLVFEPIFKYFKTLQLAMELQLGNLRVSWKVINYPPTSANSLAPEMIFCSTKMRVKFDISCLKQEKTTFKHNIILKLCSI